MSLSIRLRLISTRLIIDLYVIKKVEMLRKIELWCLITLISIVYGLNFKCKHLENSTIYQNSEEFCKDRDIKKVPNSVADKSSLNLVCTLTAHLIDDKSCLSIKEAVIGIVFLLNWLIIDDYNF